MEKMERVLVTGANGLLGTNLVLCLLEQNYSVKAFVRNPDNFIPYSHPALDLVAGDISDISTLEPHLKECDFVIHAAAYTAQNALKLSEYHSTNFVGTRNIITLCKRYGIKRLVNIGTANNIGYGTQSNPGNENSPMRFPHTRSLYALSKLKAQQLIDEAGKSLDVVTVSPTFMLGAYDSKPSSGKILLMTLGRKVIFCPPGGKNFVHVKDVALGTINALRNGERGENYLLSNENLTYKQFFKKVALVTHSEAYYIVLPRFIFYPMGWFGELLRKMGIKTDLTSANMEILTIKTFYSNQKARKLGVSFTNVDAAITDAVNWFRKTKKISL
ncbi:MAG: NAD-dependent epimerase/dehydratase family protein [Bacteroidetes bacterium]|nr:MAG: NAD-dependent epimerase/dehydratase family protein [Bacteroidota bacterium]